MFVSYILITLVFQNEGVKGKQSLPSADEVMREIKAKPPIELKHDPLKALTLESTILRSKLDKLSDQKAAVAWVDLVSHFEAETSGQSTTNATSIEGWAQVMKALPPPTSWPSIRGQLTKLPPDRTLPIIAMFDDMLGHEKEALKYLESKRKPDADPEKEDVFSPEAKISDAELSIALRAGDLDLVSKIYIRKAYGNTFSWTGFPDVVGLFGKQKAEPLMRKMLEGAKQSFMNFNGKETRRLARAIVLSDLGHMRAPHWELIQGFDDFPFVSAQVKRFGEGSVQGGYAAFVYAVGLANHGQKDHALRFLSSQSDASYNDWENPQPRKAKEATYALVTKLLNRKWVPSLAEPYMQLGEALDKDAEVNGQLQEWLSSSKLDASARSRCLGWKARLDSRMGRTALAINEYEEVTQLKVREDNARAPEKLLSIATATADSKVIEFLKKAAKTTGTRGSRLDFFDAYDQIGQIAEAQEASIKSMEDVYNVKLEAEGQGRLLDAYPDSGVELAELYYKSNQPDQVLTLLHEFPKWGAEDLGAIITCRRGSAFWNAKSKPLGFYAAWALAKTGQVRRAIEILHALISLDAKDDAVFELLNRLEGSAALGLYDKVIKANPNEARPFIWKGDLLLRMGKPVDARKSVQAAIALDPTDGDALDQRQVAYDILSRVYKAEGKSDASKATRSVYLAAQVTKKAKQFEDADLLPQAALLFKRALDLSPKQYGAQIHYARVLKSMNKGPQALRESEKALSLLPTNQGSVGGASNSFYLNDAEDRDILEKVIKKIRGTGSHNPLVLFSLGELESEKGDERAALESYLRAVKYDPNYVRAWNEISDLAAKGVAGRAQAKAAALALIRLDPGNMRIIYSGSFEKFGDYPALWMTVRHTSGYRFPATPSPLFPLEASKRSLAGGTRPADLRESFSGFESPGDAVGKVHELEAFFPYSSP